jgi:methylthioribose-1-phosphate isomerase
MKTIWWDKNKKSVMLLDQTVLPSKVEIRECRSGDELEEAIKSLRIRGAPALEVAGAFGVVLACKEGKNLHIAKRLPKTRPTAVNLSRGVGRAMNVARKGKTKNEMFKLALKEARKIMREDVRRNKLIGKYGARLLRDGDVVMTYCNAGRLACTDYGTALGVIRTAIKEGKNIKVVACETRPLLQGSRLTVWELLEDGIDVMLITDNAGPWIIRKGIVDKIVVGADRITKDAVFNKIGTYSLALAAFEHGIPFYVAAPLSTFDFERREKDVKVEERDGDEVRYFSGTQVAPSKVKVYNPAFDATPLDKVSAIITEKGLIYP